MHKIMWIPQSDGEAITGELSQFQRFTDVTEEEIQRTDKTMSVIMLRNSHRVSNLDISE